MMPTYTSYGVVIIDADYKFLLLKQYEGSWTFPKGHIEEGETPRQTALRELQEEAAITDVELFDLPLLHEEYEINFVEKALKVNEYFIGMVKNLNVTIQQSEITEYAWVTYEEALEKFVYPERKEVLKKAKEYLDEYEQNESAK